MHPTLDEVERKANECIDAGEAASYIQDKFVDFENGFRKSTAAPKKRLIQKTIKQIALTGDRVNKAGFRPGGDVSAAANAA